MTKTKYYDLQMDDPQDDYDVDVVNANLKKIDEQMKTRENATDALQEPEFTVAAKRENIASKEKMPKILGKIAKFFADLKTVAFSGKYNDLDGKPAIVNNNTTTEPGSALDARQANPNIEGTMAASIAQINNDLKGLLHERSIALPQTTVLDYIVYVNSPIGCQTFTAEHSSDLPRSTGEFNILWFGSGNNYNGSRLHVIAIPYSSSTTRKIYAREYFNQNWLTDWYEL
nr:MAG TPA: hypothetical protein [Caudoviricetes sp.]